MERNSLKPAHDGMTYFVKGGGLLANFVHESRRELTVKPYRTLARNCA